MRTLCLPITKETLRLQGLTKLDQLVSRMMYSPFRAQKRMDEWSNGCPAYWRTAEKAKIIQSDHDANGHKSFFLHLLNSVDSLFLWIPNIMGRSLGCRWRRTGVPIRSWGRYPRRGTALMHRETRKITSNQFHCPLMVWWFECQHAGLISQKKKDATMVYLSSTSWNTQLGVCVVVKMRLSVGILGALEKRKELNQSSVTLNKKKKILMPTSALVELIIIFMFLYPTTAHITYFNVTDFNYVKNLPLFYIVVTELRYRSCSKVLTIVTRVDSLSQQEAAELVFSMHSVLDLHQVGRHTERIVLQIPLALLPTTKKWVRRNDKLNQVIEKMSVLFQYKFVCILDFKLFNTRGQC